MNEPTFAAYHWAYAIENHVQNHVPNTVRDVALLPTGGRALSDETKARIAAGVQAWDGCLEEARTRARTNELLGWFTDRELQGAAAPPVHQMPRYRPNPVNSDGSVWSYGTDDYYWAFPELPMTYLFSTAGPRKPADWLGVALVARLGSGVPAEWDKELAGGER